MSAFDFSFSRYWRKNQKLDQIGEFGFLGNHTPITCDIERKSLTTFTPEEEVNRFVLGQTDKLDPERVYPRVSRSSSLWTSDPEIVNAAVISRIHSLRCVSTLIGRVRYRPVAGSEEHMRAATEALRCIAELYSEGEKKKAHDLFMAAHGVGLIQPAI